MTLLELAHSNTALRLGIDNTIPASLTDNAAKTLAMLDRIKQFLGKPLVLNSGYRCLELNKVIGSKDTSDHVKALACDFVVPGVSTFTVAKKLALAMEELGIGQLIYEHTWIHVGIPTPSKIINRILTVQKWGYSAGITNGA